MKPAAVSALVKSTFFLRSLIVGIGIWILLAGNNREEWVIGLSSAWLFACLILLSHKTTAWIHWSRLPGFAVFFIFQSIIAGLHVAFAALGPSKNIKPGWIELPARLPPGPPQALFSNLISLLPGTLCGDLDENGVHHIHLLSAKKDPEPELRNLETRVGRLFGLRLEKGQA